MLVTLLLSLAALSSGTLGNTCTLGEHVNKVDLLNLHNQARNLMKVPQLTWDDDLACFSQSWAERCVFEHSHREGYGENIACGYGKNYAAETGVQDWYKEIYGYRPSMGYDEEHGHVTQMGWQDTTHVGCGIAECSANSLGLSTGNEKSLYLVCNYSPPGNYLNHFIGEVHIPSSNRMIDLKHNATNNDANPALFGQTKASIPQHRQQKVDAEAIEEPQGKKQEETRKSSNNNNHEGHSTNNDQSHNRNQNQSRPPQRKNQHTVYKGTGGFTTTSWEDLQKWIQDKCAKGLAYSYKWYSTWENKKRALPSALGEIDPQAEDDKIVSRKGTSRFVNPKMGLHRRLMRKRRITMKL